MDADSAIFLIVCPLVFLGGFVDAIAGGGGLITLPAYILSGLPMHNALATNKLSSTPGAVVAAYRYWRGGFIDVAFILPSVIAALIGSFAGARLVLLVPEAWLQYVLLALLPISACVVLRQKTLSDDPSRSLPRPRARALAVLVSLTVGMYDGFYGPGTGTFLILLFCAVVKMDVRGAVGACKAVNLASNVAAFAAFLLGGKMVFALGLSAAAFGMAGQWLGAGLAIKKGSRIVRPVILAVLCLLFARAAFFSA